MFDKKVAQGTKRAGIPWQKYICFYFKVLLINSTEQIYSKQFLIGKGRMSAVTEPLAVELK